MKCLLAQLEANYTRADASLNEIREETIAGYEQTMAKIKAHHDNIMGSR